MKLSLHRCVPEVAYSLAVALPFRSSLLRVLRLATTSAVPLLPLFAHRRPLVFPTSPETGLSLMEVTIAHRYDCVTGYLCFLDPLWLPIQSLDHPGSSKFPGGLPLNS